MNQKCDPNTSLCLCITNAYATEVRMRGTKSFKNASSTKLLSKIWKTRRKILPFSSRGHLAKRKDRPCLFFSRSPAGLPSECNTMLSHTRLSLPFLPAPRAHHSTNPGRGRNPQRGPHALADPALNEEGRGAGREGGSLARATLKGRNNSASFLLKL